MLTTYLTPRLRPGRLLAIRLGEVARQTFVKPLKDQQHRSGPLLRLSWLILGPSWPLLGCSWVPLGAPLAALGVLLEPFWPRKVARQTLTKPVKNQQHRF